MELHELLLAAEKDCQPLFDRLEETEMINTRRVLNAFQAEDIATRHFAPTTGYGYDDIGRDKLEAVFARLFGTECAIVRPAIACGTAALSLCLFGLLLPGDHLLSATGAPYDTMETVIGLSGHAVGSLKEMGVDYSQVEMKEQREIDVDQVIAALRPNTKVILIQRSRGYAWRSSLQPVEMKPLIDAVHALRPDIFIMVDNCYGEFICENEPTHFGADVCVGSLIKNPGGGLAPTGAYLAGTRRAIERIEARLTAPGLGREVGSYAASYQPFYQGLFMAPHTVTQALKTAILAARVFEYLGMKTTPASDGPRADIIQAIEMGDPNRLIAFVQGIQAASPIDGSAVPEPWDMPGYTDQVIMAAGTFVAGASIELSADAPMRPPYTVYLQGGLTYAHGKIALLSALEKMQKDGSLS
ncbi:MAG: methionine gamma-lyase family protein [Clostridia bacterium]|nr:methionine gamma-lyase family protein [Clostridia bacterium]